ncbi:MAG TPA: hypothetical protein VJ499_01495 [Flavisolibacter sp.]|nr:hypothetical protein [Flavisolibacter sp.]
MEKNQRERLNNPSDMTGPDRGRQGNDKAPGEEPHEGTIENIVVDTQKAKDKPEGDPPREERDHPGDV